MSDILTQMHRVLDAGIALKERLERGERPDLSREQAELKVLLVGDNELRRMPDYVGDGGGHGQSIIGGGGHSLIGGGLDVSIIGGGGGRGSGSGFRGVQYALTCWLDEIFTIDSPSDWANSWNEQKLETELLRSNARREGFWSQAKLAEIRPGTEVLEAFYWCVMLGFRGALREDPVKLDNWVRATRARLVSGQQSEWPLPPEREVPTNVPPRGAKDSFQNMMMAWQVAMLIAVPFVTYILIRVWGQ
jgi:hypothetical protein